MRYFYDGTTVLYTTDDAGNLTTKNLVGTADNAIATRRYEGSYADKNYFYLKDIRGSVTSIVDESMNGVASYEYDEFGITTVNGNQEFENQICYTGGIYDELTGLYYLNARYYDPETGRFLSEDTYRGEANDFATWHLYVYCANNPVNYTDPSGHWVAAIGTATQSSAIFYMKLGAYIAVDGKGNVGAFEMGGMGVKIAIPGISTGIQVIGATNSTIKSLHGWSIDVSATITTAVVEASAGLSIGQDSVKGNLTGGLSSHGAIPFSVEAGFSKIKVKRTMSISSFLRKKKNAKISFSCANKKVIFQNKKSYIKITVGKRFKANVKKNKKIIYK